MLFCILLGTVIKVLENWLGVEGWMDVAKRDPAQAAQLLEDHIHIEAARKLLFTPTIILVKNKIN